MIHSFDIETFSDGSRLVPYCVCWYNGKTYNTYYGTNCIDDFIDSAFRYILYNKSLKKKDVFFFSHNLSFDGLIILQNTKNKSITYSGLFYKGNVYFMNLLIDGVAMRLKCSYRFFPLKLERAAGLLGASTKLFLEHNKINKENYIDMRDVVEEYCKRDAYISYEIMNVFNKTISVYKKKWINNVHTISSVSYTLFKEIFNILELETKLKKEDDSIFRPAYYGGRCEVFGNPRDDDYIYHYDYTGMYAQCMLESFNYGRYTIVESPSCIEENGFYHIEYYSEMEIPVLPFHSRDGKLLFSNGICSGLYWWEEISLFEKHGGIIIKINYHIKFEKNGYVFKNFIETFAELRKKSDVMNYIGKLIVNSLYGRMGMGFIEDRTIIIKKEELEEYRLKNEVNIQEINEINNLCIIREKIKKEVFSNSNVYIAAMITSKARIKLYKGFMNTIEHNGRILYCDTDSIFACFSKNMDNVKYGEVFWDISKSDTKLKNALFAMPKAYGIVLNNGDERIKIKGINKNNISFNNFKSTFEKNSSIHFNMKQLKKSKYNISIEDISKIINLKKYDKRFFDTTYVFTEPLFIKNNIKTFKNKINHPESFLQLYNDIYRNGNPFTWKTDNIEYGDKRLIYGVYTEINEYGLTILYIKKNIVETSELLFHLINFFEYKHHTLHEKSIISIHSTLKTHDALTLTLLDGNEKKFRKTTFYKIITSVEVKAVFNDGRKL